MMLRNKKLSRTKGAHRFATWSGVIIPHKCIPCGIATLSSEAGLSLLSHRRTNKEAELRGVRVGGESQTQLPLFTAGWPLPALPLCKNRRGVRANARPVGLRRQVVHDRFDRFAHSRSFLNFTISPCLRHPADWTPVRLEP
jgi:hypothetical protein